MTDWICKLPFPPFCGSPLTYAITDHSEAPRRFSAFHCKSNLQFHTKKDIFLQQVQSFESVESLKANVGNLVIWMFPWLSEKNASSGL